MTTKNPYSSLLGDEYSVTTMFPGDEDVDAHGLPALYTPRGAKVDEDTEDDVAFRTLEEESSPGEAQRTVEHMRPLSASEEEMIEEFPDAAEFSRVDDAAQEDYLLRLTKRGYQAMDAVLEDAVYGEEKMDNDEKLERTGRDAEVGFGIPGLSTLKKIATAPTSIASKIARRLPGGKYADRLARAPMSAARKVAGAVVKKFVPSRDAQKASMMKSLYGKLVTEHANWLGIQDQNTGRTVQPMSAYLAASKPWARQQIARGGLPTSFAVSGADVLGADIVGDDVVGSWWNPLSWFASQTQVVINNTAGQRSEIGPDGQPVDSSQYQDPTAYQDQSSYQDPYAADASSYQDPYAADYAQGDDQPTTTVPNRVKVSPKLLAKIDRMIQTRTRAERRDPDALKKLREDLVMVDALRARASKNDELAKIALQVMEDRGVFGRPAKVDSLGAFVGEVLGADASPAPDPKGDELMARAVDKLRSGQGLAPGELAVVARLAKGGHSRARRVLKVLSAEGTTSGAWAHKLNPLYWLKSSEERNLVDKEREGWIENARIQKEAGKRQEVLAQAEKAKQAADAVAAAKAQAEATEAQLAAIKASISGDLMERLPETFVGHEKPTAVSEVVVKALDEDGKKDRAKEIWAKIVKKEALDEADLRDARAIAKILRRVKVVHGDLVKDDSRFSDTLGAFAGACLSGRVEAARAKSSLCGKAAAILAEKIASGSPLDEREKQAARKLGSGVASGRKIVCACTSSGAFVGLDKAEVLRRHCVVGAAQAAMTPAEKKMISAMQKLAKAGNPRAASALASLRKSGAVVGGDHVGSIISDSFNWAMKPLKLPAQMLYKGAKWTGQQLGIVSKGSSPEQARLARMRAAAQRRKAAQAKAAAADAQTEAELRAQQSIADAADAEAEAADAEALAKEAAMRTAEDAAVSGDETFVGSFVGGWAESHVGAKDKKIVAVASSNTAAGMKVRAGAKLYQRIKKGDPEAKKALKVMIEKSQKGDAQATRDLRAIYAGRTAVIARQKARSQAVRSLVEKAKGAKVKAVQKKLEAQAAEKLVRMERKHKLRKIAIVEKKASSGDKKAQAYVKKQVELSRRGDKKAVSNVEALKLARAVRAAAPTRREQRNVAQAGRLLAKARKGDPRAVRQVQVIQAAAKAGNPNARRAKKRLETAALVATAITTGVVATATAKKKAQKEKKACAETLARAKTKLGAGTGTREEYLAGAKAARTLGDKTNENQLALAAATAPSATLSLRSAGNVAAARDAGNPEAKAAIQQELATARAGDPEAIRTTGNLVAAQTIDDLQKGKPVPPAMRDAVNLQARAAEGDKEAQDTIRRVTEAATGPDVPAEATMAAVSLAAAATIAKALADRPKARQEFLERVNAVPASERPEAEGRLADLVRKAKDGTITADEGVVAVRLAERLGKPKVAAQVAAMAPPPPPSTAMSSLPDSPMPPITSFFELLKESAKALLLATRDPIGNYREGIFSRSSTGVVTGDETGWSPFDFFKKRMSVILPAVAAASSTATLVSTLASKAGKTSRPAPTASAAPAQSQIQASSSPGKNQPSEAPKTESKKEEE